MEKKGTLASPATALAKKGFSRSRRPHKQGSFRDFSTQFCVFLRVLQEIHNFPDLHFGLFQSGHIVKIDLHTGFLIENLRLGFSHAENIASTGATAASHSAKHIDPDAHDQRKGITHNMISPM